MRASAWLLTILLASAGACSRSTQVSSGSGGMPGIGETWVQEGSFGGDLAFIVWSDIAEKDCQSSSSGGGSYAGSRGVNANYQGKRIARDGRNVEWQAETGDGKSGVVTINGTTFRLEEGQIFLVTTTGEEAGVRQVEADLSNLKPMPETWDRLSRENAEIREYLTRVAGPN